MTIVDNRGATIYQFSDLKPGECFSFEGSGNTVYMKTVPILDHGHIERNAVNMTENCMAHINPSTAVTPLNCKLVIE